MDEEKNVLVDTRPPVRVSARAKQILVILGVLCLTAVRFRYMFAVEPENGWALSEISPDTKGIKWGSCPDSTITKCGTLNVPLNYLDPENYGTVTLFLRKLPAKGKKVGTLLTNPGGPGGSGTSLVLRKGEKLSDILENKLDIVSWDPRAVNLTNPSLSCMTEQEEDLYQYNYNSLHLTYPWNYRHNSSHSPKHNYREDSDYVSRVLAFGNALGTTCEARGNVDMIRASSTAFTARDIKSIMEALGEPYVYYWGFSYGTVLGATFAAMFPELSHRVILDGVVNSNLYFNDLISFAFSSMSETHKTFDWLLGSCEEGGPEKCAFAEKGKSVSESFWALIHDIHHKPLAVPALSGGVPRIVTSSDIQLGVFKSLYVPSSWPDFFDALAGVKNGNGTLFTKYMAQLEAVKDYPFPNQKDKSFGFGTQAIMCGDTNSLKLDHLGQEAFVHILERLNKLSPTAANWMHWFGSCRHWPRLEPFEVYRGPFALEKGLRPTKNPVLFIGNTADPVTPLSSAVAMNEGFGTSSRLLVIDSPGHCSGSIPSKCFEKIVRDYVLDGILPEDGYTCKGDEPNFPF